MRIKYNAPTVLTYTLLCALVLFLNAFFPGLILNWFLVPGRNTFHASSFRNWVTVFTHVAGHKDWSHLINNFTLILLIGPMLEETYGSKSLFVMIITTALVTGFLNILLFNSALMGASGVVFMMILLSSFTNFNSGEIPLTFILVMILYLFIQLFNASGPENISHFAHVVGGLCGSFFGFFRPQRKPNYV
jgi:membrane associated rhomboid family serine protease